MPTDKPAQAAPRRFDFTPMLWASLLFIIGQALTFLAINKGQEYVASEGIVSPEISPQFPILYFLIVTAVVGMVLFFIPVRWLKYVFKVIFAGLFAWGMFIFIFLILEQQAALAIGLAAAGGIAWLVTPRVWLQNLLLLIALVSVGTVFGFSITPWAVVILMAVISVYDLVSVRIGYMVWMAGKLADTATLPAFIFPKNQRLWNMDLNKSGFGNLIKSEPAEREFSILGGGDIGFPLVLIVSVFFAFGGNGFAAGLIVGAFTLLGLFADYALQHFLLKGRPLAALPPITVCGTVGFLLVNFVLFPG